MTIERIQSNSELKLKLTGRLDTLTSPQLEAEIKNLAGITSLVLDCANLEYISSAGLRVILQAKKSIGQGSMVVSNTNSTVKEIFDITGFSKIIDVK